MDLTPLRRAATVILLAPLLATASPQSRPRPPPRRARGARPSAPRPSSSTSASTSRRRAATSTPSSPTRSACSRTASRRRSSLLETPSTRERTVPPEVTLALDVSSSVMDDRLLDESLLKEVLLRHARRAGAHRPVRLRRRAALPDPADARGGRAPGRLPAGHRVRPRAAPRRARGSTPPSPTWPSRPKDGEKAQRAIIVFSDGLDNKDGKMGQALDAALAADVRVYTIALSQSFQATARGVRPGQPAAQPRRCTTTRSSTSAAWPS